MRFINVILFVCAIGFANQLNAKEIVFYGTLLDTVLETASGKDPVMKIYPVSGAKIYFETGCTEEVLAGKYFAQSGIDGRFSVKVNLPDACTYRRYLINAACTTMSKEAIFNRFGIEDTVVTDSFYVNFSQNGIYATDSIRDPSYMHLFSWAKKSQYIAGDSISFILTTRGLVDNPDTLRYPSCQTRMVLTTSNGSVVYDTGIGCYENQHIYVPKGMYTQSKWNLVIPRELEKYYPDFKEDRTINLSYFVFTSAIRKTVSFTVVDSGIKIVNTTGVKKRNSGNSTINRCANMRVTSKGLSLKINIPGKYKVELYSVNGKLISSPIQNQFLHPGTYMIPLHQSLKNSHSMVIVRLTNQDRKSVTVTNVFSK